MKGNRKTGEGEKKGTSQEQKGKRNQCRAAEGVKGNARGGQSKNKIIRCNYIRNSTLTPFV